MGINHSGAWGRLSARHSQPSVSTPRPPVAVESVDVDSLLFFVIVYKDLGVGHSLPSSWKAELRMSREQMKR